jgi:hypothetical protein
MARFVLAYKGCIAWRIWHDGGAVYYQDRNGIAVREEPDRTQWSYAEDAPIQAQTLSE